MLYPHDIRTRDTRRMSGRVQHSYTVSLPPLPGRGSVRSDWTKGRRR